MCCASVRCFRLLRLKPFLCAHAGDLSVANLETVTLECIPHITKDYVKDRAVNVCAALATKVCTGVTQSSFFFPILSLFCVSVDSAFCGISDGPKGTPPYATCDLSLDRSAAKTPSTAWRRT